MSNCVRTASTSSSANRDAEARTNPAASENGTMTSTSVPSAGRRRGRTRPGRGCKEVRRSPQRPVKDEPSASERVGDHRAVDVEPGGQGDLGVVWWGALDSAGSDDVEQLRRRPALVEEHRRRPEGEDLLPAEGPLDDVAFLPARGVGART